MIVVGIDNAEEARLDEYGPWQTDVGTTPEVKNVGGYGMEYGRWVVETVKPFIDHHYRTRREAQQTLLAGSSMGALSLPIWGRAILKFLGIWACFLWRLGLANRHFWNLFTTIRYIPGIKFLSK